MEGVVEEDDEEEEGDEVEVQGGDGMEEGEGAVVMDQSAF